MILASLQSWYCVAMFEWFKNFLQFNCNNTLINVLINLLILHLSDNVKGWHISAMVTYKKNTGKLSIDITIPIGTRGENERQVYIWYEK